MWREIVAMRGWGVDLRLFSTRRPDAASRARHAFAELAEAETFYLWPLKPGAVIVALLWAMARHPIGLTKAFWLGLTLPVNKRPAAKTVLPLIVPAAVFARQVARLQLSRLHSHTCSNSAILCMMVKRLIGVPFSMTLNANVEWWGGAMREKFADADFTIAITQWLLEQMRRDFPELREDQALLGRIGVDTRRWRPAADERRETRDPVVAPSLISCLSSPAIITVGRLHASKGHDVLLRAVKQLAEEHRDIRLRLCGEGPERANLESLTRELGVADRVTFLGSLSEDQIIEQMRTADVFALASHAEPLGVVYMEAMSMSVATIGTAAGGVGEIITDGVDGLLVPPNDPAALAAAIRRLIDDDSLRHRLAGAGRDTVVKNFDSRIGAATLYRRIFGQEPPAEENEPQITQISQMRRTHSSSSAKSA
jgi:glycosyltransferase involved in cell wall biosynthesis